MARIRGAKGFKIKISQISGPEMVRQVGAALYAGGQILENDMARSITEGSVSGKGHIPSKPGEPPNADTHVLDRSIQTVSVAPLKVAVVVDAPYAVALNYGTSKMAARPFAEPAVARTRKEITSLVQRAVKKIVRGGKVVA